MEYCNGMMYTVKQGDTLYSISLKHGIPLVVLIRANPYVDVYHLQVGETVCIPMKQGGCSGSCRGNTEEEHNSFDGSYAREEETRRTMTEEQDIGEEQDMEEEERRPEWQRYISKPGDTLDMVMNMECPQSWEEFLEHNPMERIYLLPGIAYHCKKM